MGLTDIIPEQIKAGQQNEARRIKAKVVATGKVVSVTDGDIDGIYNMWHEDQNGNLYHDDELLFLEPRIQAT